MIKLTATALLLSTSLLIGACASKPIKTELPSDELSRQAELANLGYWQLHARIGLRSKNRSGSATLIWEETPKSRKLRLIGPLGGGVIQLQQDAKGVTITDSTGKVWIDNNAEDLILRVTGWQIPVSGLRWWLLGLVEPGSKAASTFGRSQNLNRVQQDGWNVTLDNYTLYDDYRLPAAIVVESEYDKDHERYLRAKLIIKDWKFDIKEPKL
ncbi:MAG: outer membrane lipoprotein LolB [Gammaproteobacteria bacterium]|nr:outer membrane lipoprotein LolB [Gammaproteobacteria bacterium]